MIYTKLNLKNFDKKLKNKRFNRKTGTQEPLQKLVCFLFFYCIIIVNINKKVY